MAQAGGCQMFFVHKFWQVQVVTDACTICSAVLWHCTFALLREEKRKKNNKKRKNGFPEGMPTAAGP
jgi:hypothetical protein